MDEFLRHRASGRCGCSRVLNIAIYALNCAAAVLGRFASASGCGCRASSPPAPSRWRRRWCMRFQGMSQWVMWEISALFENIGTVRDGINSLSLPAVVHDKPGAPALARGQWRHPLRPGGVPLRQGAAASSTSLDLHIRPGRKGRSRRPLRRRQVDHRQPAAALLRPRGRHDPDRRHRHRHGDAGIRCAPISAS